ncbi:unnamed protein product [Cochlearia groenlandica]
MVLSELGVRITRALHNISNATIIDENALNECLNEITLALFSNPMFPSLSESDSTARDWTPLPSVSVSASLRAKASAIKGDLTFVKVLELVTNVSCRLPDRIHPAPATFVLSDHAASD